MGDHIFISYSRKDQAIVDRIVAILQGSNIAVWRDHEQIQPGTPDWEQAIRQGITTARGVIYAASEDAAKSQYVRHELLIARDNTIPIYPLWIAGAKWSDCVPLGFANIQYADGRRDLNDSIKATIGQLRITRTPMPSATTQKILVYSGWEDDISIETGHRHDIWCDGFESALQAAGYSVYIQQQLWQMRAENFYSGWFFGTEIQPDIVLLAFTPETGNHMTRVFRDFHGYSNIPSVISWSRTPTFVLTVADLRREIDQLFPVRVPIIEISGVVGKDDGEAFLRYLRLIRFSQSN